MDSEFTEEVFQQEFFGRVLNKELRKSADG
jgi:hypothetical protein